MDDRAWRISLRNKLTDLARTTRATVPSPGSANPFHRADDLIRDTLENVLHDTRTGSHVPRPADDDAAPSTPVPTDPADPADPPVDAAPLPRAPQSMEETLAFLDGPGGSIEGTLAFLDTPTDTKQEDPDD